MDAVREQHSHCPPLQRKPLPEPAFFMYLLYASTQKNVIKLESTKDICPII